MAAYPDRERASGAYGPGQPARGGRPKALGAHSGRAAPRGPRRSTRGCAGGRRRPATPPRSRNVPRCGGPPSSPVGRTSRVPWMATATIGMLERSAVAKAPPRNLPTRRVPSKVPSGKNTERLTGGGELPHPACVRSSLVTVETLDEGRAEPPEQQARQRHADHLLLDDKGEVGRQGGRGDDSVDIARMVGDDHARSLRQALASLDPEPNPGAPQEPSRGHARRPSGARAGRE